MEVELECAVYGEGTVFPVRISRDAKVSALQEAIFYKKRYGEQYKFDSSALTLYLAGNVVYTPLDIILLESLYVKEAIPFSPHVKGASTPQGKTESQIY
jgi:hypothetical protein